MKSDDLFYLCSDIPFKVVGSVINQFPLVMNFRKGRSIVLFKDQFKEPLLKGNDDLSDVERNPTKKVLYSKLSVDKSSEVVFSQQRCNRVMCL